MRGEPVLPSKFVSLFEYPLENSSNLQQLRSQYMQYDEIEQSSEKLNENLSNFNQYLTQTVADINELLRGSYTRISCMEQVPELTNLNNNDVATNYILNQSITENVSLPDKLSSEIEEKLNLE